MQLSPLLHSPIKFWLGVLCSFANFIQYHDRQTVSATALLRNCMPLSNSVTNYDRTDAASYITLAAGHDAFQLSKDNAERNKILI